MSTLRIYLFGCLRVYYGDERLPPFPTRKTRSLFAYLLTDRGRTHPRSVLAGIFWGSMPDARAHRNLNTTLWRLRRVLPPGYLRQEEDTVAFNTAAPHWLDTASFERHLVQAAEEGSDRVDHLRRAAALYRGDFLEGFYEDWLLVEAERLRGLYQQALEALFAHFRSAGHYQTALEFGRQLLAIDPLREEIYRGMMATYFSLGQRSSALAQFETCRRVLSEDLDVEPLPETLALYERVRAVSPGSQPSPLPPPQLPERRSLPRTPFDDFGQVRLVGRRQELDWLMTCVARQAEGHGGWILVTGEAGVGKTRLMQELACEAAGRGVAVLHGQCYELEESSPYQGVLEALRGSLADLTEGDLAGVSRVWLADLVVLLPELAQICPHLPPPPINSPQQRRGRLLEALAQFVVGLGTVAPHLLILDDLHWADLATLEVLRYLLPRLSQARILLVGTARPGEIQASKELSQAITGLEGSGFLGRLSLPSLTPEETEQLVQQVLGLARPAPRFARRVYRETEGNPFFVGEVLKALFEDGLLYQDASGGWNTPWDDDAQAHAELPLPRGIRQAVTRRLARLERDGRAALELAAVLGREFDFDLLWHASGQEEAGMLEATDDLLRRQLLEERGDTLRFTHDKIRQAAYEGLSHARRRMLHRQAGLVLEGLAPDRVEELARHFHHGEVWEKALTYGLAAGDKAKHLYANQEAIAYYTRALSLLQEEDERTAAVLMHLGEVYHLLADEESARASYRRALGLWERVGDKVMLAEVYYALAQSCIRTGQHAKALRHARRGLSFVEPGGTERAIIKGYRLLARCFHISGEFQAMRESIAKGMKLAERIGDWYGLAEYNRLLGDLSTLGGDCRGSLAFNLRAAELFRKVEGHDDREAMLCNNIAVKYLGLGEAENALCYARQGLELAQRVGAVTAEGWLYTTVAEIFTYLGQWEEAKRELRRGLALAEKIHNRQLQAIFHADLGLVAQGEGDAEGAIACLERALAMAIEVAPQHVALWNIHLADIHVDRGGLKQGRELIVESLAKARDRQQRTVLGLAFRAQGRLERAKGRWEKASRAFEESLAVFREPENQLEIAKTLYECGLTHLAAGEVGRGQNVLEEVLQVFVALGAKVDELKVRDVLQGRRIRVRLAAREVPLGRPVREDELVTLLWTVDAGLEDERLRQRQGKVALRRARILRLLEEAQGQGAAATEADLASVLCVTVRTIKRDISSLRREGREVRTRGSKRPRAPDLSAEPTPS